MSWLSVFAVPPDQAAWAALAVGFAAAIRAFTGFGFALLVVPVFSLFLAPGDAVVLSAALALILGAVSHGSWWGLFPTTPAIPMLVGASAGTAIGVWILASLSVNEFQLWIGLLVVVASVVTARFKPSERSSSSPVALGTGVASGLMNGAFAIPGPPVILYVIATMDNPSQSRAFLIVEIHHRIIDKVEDLLLAFLGLGVQMFADVALDIADDTDAHPTALVTGAGT